MTQVSDQGLVTVADGVPRALNVITHTSISFGGLCSCAIGRQSCESLTLIYFNGTSLYDFIQIFTELKTTCIPMFGFMDSYIGWWYNESYTEKICETYSFAINSQPVPNLRPLNSSIFSRFNQNRTSTLIRQLLVEEAIISEPSYDQFYNQCAPTSCSYKIQQTRPILLAVLLLISICGMISRGLKLSVPLFGNTFLACWRLRKNWRILLSKFHK